MSQKPRAWIATPAENRMAWVIATGCAILIVGALLWPLKESPGSKPVVKSPGVETRPETRLEAKQSSGAIEKIIEKVQREEPRKVRITPEPEERSQPVKVITPAPEPEKAVAVAPKTVVPATTTPPSLPKGYYVQLGAFKEKSRAFALQKKLAPGIKTHLKKKTAAMTAVWAGPYTSSAAATQARAEIARKTGIKGFTVKN